MALFMPLPLAVAVTAVVHFLNNLFKWGLFRGKAHWPTALRFGVPALAAALVGAFCLKALGAHDEALLTYVLGSREHAVTPLKLVLAALMAVFALFEAVPSLKNMALPPKYLPLGGLLSGFFGGLSGHQGALRSVFLLKAGLTKEQFVATGVVLACIVDAGRIVLYGVSYGSLLDGEALRMVVVATAAAFVGAYGGSRLLKKITIAAVQNIVTVLLLLIAVALGAGLI